MQTLAQPHSDRISTAVRSPQQARSRDTLRRIVDATRALLEEKPFHAITVTEITQRARSSVGAFYNRFVDKESLLDYLDELYAREVIEQCQALADRDDHEDASLRQLIQGLLRFLIDFHRQRPGLLRTLILEARMQPEGSFRERTERMKSQLPPLLDLLAARSEEITHPHPKLAIWLGFVMVFHTIREVILFPEALPPGEAPDSEELVTELTDAYLAYLGSRAKDR